MYTSAYGFCNRKKEKKEKKKHAVNIVLHKENYALFIGRMYKN